MSSCGSNAGMEMTAPAVNAIVNNALFHSNLHIIQMLPQNHSHPALLSGRHVAPDFVINCVEVRTVQCPEIRKFIWVSLHYCTFGLEAAGDPQLTARITTSKIHQI